MIELLVIAAMSTAPVESGQLDGDYTQRRYVCQANGEFFKKGETACLNVPGTAPCPLRHRSQQFGVEADERHVPSRRSRQSNRGT